MPAFARPCDQCGAEYLAQRRSSRFCSDRCRALHRRSPAPQLDEPAPEQDKDEAPSGGTPIFEATRTALEAATAHLTDMDKGAQQVMLRLAKQIDSLPYLSKDDAGTYLTYATALGLIPASAVRAGKKGGGKSQGGGGTVSRLRAIAGGSDG